MTSEEKMREEFERAVVRDWADCLADLTRNGDGYEAHHIESAWWAWRESRESLVIELPEMIGMNQPFTGTSISEIRAHNHFNDAIKKCRESIHAAGVKTK